MARLELGDNWDPEPGAWRRLAAVLHNQQHVGISADPVKVEPGSLASYKIAVLTGTTKWSRVRLHLERIADMVDTTTPGSYTEIPIPFDWTMKKGGERLGSFSVVSTK